MTLKRQLLFWLGGFALLVLALVLFSPVLLPFIAGLATAYFLDPVATRLERLGLSRLAASILILAAFFGVFILLAIVLLPILIDQFGSFIEQVPRLVERLEAMVPTSVRDWLTAYIGPGGAGRRTLGQFFGEGASWLAAFFGSLWSGGQALVSVIALIVFAPVVAFYMLIDWRRMLATLDSWIPIHQRATVEDLFRQIDRAIAGFVRGQALVCFLLGTFYAVGLSLVGLNFGVLIGIMSGVLSFIPFVGSITGLVLSVGIALVQFWPDWIMVGVVLGVFAVGQFIEGNFLQPRLVGRSVGLHPVWTMFALVAFGYLFGFVGALLAVPLAAAVGVLARFALRQYLASPFYTGSTTPPLVITDETGRSIAADEDRFVPGPR